MNIWVVAIYHPEKQFERPVIRLLRKYEDAKILRNNMVNYGYKVTIVETLVEEYIDETDK